MTINTASGSANYLTIQAKIRLVNYFRRIAVAAGLSWTSENDADIEGMVDAIIRAAYLIAWEGGKDDYHRNR